MHGQIHPYKSDRVIGAWLSTGRERPAIRPWPEGGGKRAHRGHPSFAGRSTGLETRTADFSVRSAGVVLHVIAASAVRRGPPGSVEPGRHRLYCGGIVVCDRMWWNALARTFVGKCPQTSLERLKRARFEAGLGFRGSYFSYSSNLALRQPD